MWHNSPAKEKSSSTYDARLPPCVELEEPPRENLPNEMKDSSMDVDKWPVESVPVLNNDRENRILKDNPGAPSSKAGLWVWKRIQTKLEEDGKSREF